MAAFADPGAALSAAVAVQRAIARGRDLFGIDVATAARVAAQARGGEILVTEDVATRLDGAHALGRPRKVTLKGISGAQQVLPVHWEKAAG